MKPCRRCRGSGIDPDLEFRYTCGGHNSRDCKDCFGEGCKNEQASILSAMPNAKGLQETKTEFGTTVGLSPRLVVIAGKNRLTFTKKSGDTGSLQGIRCQNEVTVRLRMAIRAATTSGRCTIRLYDNPLVG